MNLAQRILEISDATRDQAQDSVRIAETMDLIREITAKTSEGSTRASGSIGELSDMVGEMERSVAGFKLPGVENTESTVVKDSAELASVHLLEDAEKKAG